MRKVFLSLALIAIIVSATMLPEVKLRATDNLAKLAKTQLGRNLLSAIQLELSSENQENIVNRVITLLQELLGQTQNQLEDNQTALGAKKDYCSTTQASYESQIEEKKGQILDAQQKIPLLVSEEIADSLAIKDLTEKQARLEQDLDNANDVNEQAAAGFAKNQRNHDNMIEALKQARALIVQLQNASFLQKNNNILMQLSEHHKTSLVTIASHQGKAIYNILLHMAQDVGTQADQQLVSKVVEVIDDLLQHEQDGSAAEVAAEAERVASYNDAVVQYGKDIEDAKTEIIRLNGEVVRIGNDLGALQANIDEWTNQQTSVEGVLADLVGQCETDVSNLNKTIADETDQIDTIQKVIDIFQGEAIQDIKPVVDNLNYQE